MTKEEFNYILYPATSFLPLQWQMKKNEDQTTKVSDYQLNASCDKVLIIFYPLSFITVFSMNYAFSNQLKEVELHLLVFKDHQFFIDNLFIVF